MCNKCIFILLLSLSSTIFAGQPGVEVWSPEYGTKIKLLKENKCQPLTPSVTHIEGTESTVTVGKNGAVVTDGKIKCRLAPGEYKASKVIGTMADAKASLNNDISVTHKKGEQLRVPYR